MQTKTETRPSVHQLEYLPGLAQYILRDRLQDFVSLQMRFINEVPLPLMRFFGQLSYQEQERLVREGAEKLLGYLARNEPAAFIEESVTQWEQNQMPVLDQSDITAEDITMATYLRKKSLLHFIPDYASGVDHIVALVNEIDLFLAEAETIFTNQYISLLRNKINEHAHFIEKITNTTPGIIYVYDVKNEREVYANRATSDFLGYSQEEIRSMGKAFVPRLIHPDDIGRLRDYEKDFQSTSDGEIRSFEYRFRNRSNEYRWLRTFETVFRRDAAGNISEKIGIAIDIHDQKLVSEELARGEAQLIEAQEIAQLGSFTWNLDTHHSTGTEQTYRILEIEPENFGSFIERVHPADQERVNEKFREAMRNGSFNCEFRYRANGSEKVIWSRGKVHFENAHPVSMTGIVMDVTEHEQLVEKLQQSEEAYKRAEAITHLGNYIWKLSDNALTWSDEMYRIYGLEPQCCKIDYDFAMSFVHPDDAPQVAEALAKAAERGGTFDFYSRIITHDGREKIVHSIGHYITDEKGRAVSAIGTAQDVTEKQKLIRQLERTQNMYRQAEELANIGNWIWDMKSKKLEWTDQLYRIYGLEPQSMPITIDTFLSFIHPDDRPAVEDGIEELYRTNYIDYTFRIIAKDGREKILRSVAHVERDENGQPVLAIGTERDVTEKTMMIRQLQESEYLYKQAQALTHVGNWTMDLQTNEFSWSDEMYNIYQLPIGTAFNIKDWEAYIHPDEKEALLEYMKECIEKKLPYEKIHRILLPDGTVKTLHRKAEFLYDEQGNAVKMIGTTQDITRQYRTEQELRDNQTFIRKITDATPSIIASYNINTGNYVFVSE
ncbi:MAG TPA: PAS domain-containing protein, partial [Flavisolibacter sp.]